MGALIYDTTRVDFEDRVLAHVQFLIATRLRRREPFLLHWIPCDSSQPARVSLWIDNAIPIRYEFDAAPSAPLDNEWLVRLNDAASRTSGVVIGTEPAPQLIRRETTAALRD